MDSDVSNFRVKCDSVKSSVRLESEQFNYESASDDSIDLNSIVLKLADVENFNVEEKIFSIEDDKFTTITLRCNNEYDRDGNVLGEQSVCDKLNENINLIDRINQSEVQNDPSLKHNQDGETHDNAVLTSKEIMQVNKMVSVTIDKECDRKLENVDNATARRDYSTNDCTMMNIVNRNMKKNIVSVGVSTNDGNANEIGGNTDSERNASDSPSEDSSGSASVTESSVNSLLNRLQYGIRDDTETSETDSSTTNSDEDMTSLDSGKRTVIYESAGSKDLDSTKNELNPELKRIDNVKTTTKSSCVLS